MRTRAALGVAAAVVVTVLLVAGALGLFSDGPSSTSGSAGSSAGSGRSVDPAAAPSAAAGTAAQSNGAQGNGAQGNGAQGNTDATDLGKAGTTAPRDVVRTAQLAVTTADPSAAADRADTIATTAGGRVDEDTRGDDTHGRAQVVLRVPADRLDATLAQLAALGRETSRTVQGDDVTARTADVGARVQALQTSVDRLRTLVATSGSLSDLLAVETQLTERQADLESLQAQQRALADQVSLATVTLDLTAPAAVAAKAAGPTGFGGAVAGGWHGFTVALRYLLAALGYTLPFLLLVAAALGVAVAVRRRRSRGQPVPSSSSP